VNPTGRRLMYVAIFLMTMAAATFGVVILTGKSPSQPVDPVALLVYCFAGSLVAAIVTVTISEIAEYRRNRTVVKTDKPPKVDAGPKSIAEPVGDSYPGDDGEALAGIEKLLVQNDDAGLEALFATAFIGNRLRMWVRLSKTRATAWWRQRPNG
jgi:hypothetical protein